MSTPATTAAPMHDADTHAVPMGERGDEHEGLLPGSVAQQIIHNAQGAVLVVRAPAAPEEKVAC